MNANEISIANWNASVVGYALYNASAWVDPSSDNKAISNRKNLAESMTTKEPGAVQGLTRETAKPGYLLKVSDNYLKHPIDSEKPSKVSSNDSPRSLPTSLTSNSQFTARPEKAPGLVSCNTRFINAACKRTHDNGELVRFKAKQVFDAFSGQ